MVSAVMPGPNAIAQPHCPLSACLISRSRTNITLADGMFPNESCAAVLRLAIGAAHARMAHSSIGERVRALKFSHNKCAQMLQARGQNDENLSDVRSRCQVS